MKMKSYELRMPPDVVERLRKLALKLGYERGREESWASLTREGAELILKTYGEPAPTRTAEEVAR